MYERIPLACWCDCFLFDYWLHLYTTKPSERDQYLGVMLGVFCFLPLINIFIAVAGLFYLFLDDELLVRELTPID